MLKNLSNQHKTATVAILLLLLVLLNSYDFIKVATHKSEYTKTIGTVIDTYTRRYGAGRSSTVVKYADVSFYYEGEEYIATGLKVNFWEGEGDTIKFYISSDMEVTRGAFILDFSDLLIFISLGICLLARIWKERDTIFASRPQPFVGTVIDEYDFVSSSPNTPEFHSNETSTTTQTTVFHSSQQNEASQETKFSSGITQTTNIPASPTASNEFAKNTDSGQAQPEASYHDIPVISIPDEFLH